MSLSSKCKEYVRNGLASKKYGTELTTAIDDAIAAANIDDAISNGVADRAPSQNAVFDALALKAPLASPTLVTPTLGVAVATSINGCTFVATAQATTNASGEITVANLTSNGVVIVTPAESITGSFGYVVATTGKFTVYNGSAAAIASKKMNYYVVSL